MMTAGYFLGQIPWIQRNFEIVVLGIVLISVLPIAGFRPAALAKFRQAGRPGESGG